MGVDQNKSYYLEGDNKMVVTTLKGRVELPWEVEVVVDNVRRVAAEVRTVSFIWVNTESNSIANKVAN